MKINAVLPTGVDFQDKMFEFILPEAILQGRE
jgi:hypothetical protein